MTDDVAREPVEGAAPTTQPDERPRRSRRRGKRSKNKSTEGQSSQGQTADAAAGQAEKPASPASARNSRKGPPHKSGFLPFDDGLDREVCPDCLRFLPREFPVQYRRGTATAPLLEVDRRDSSLLLCNGLHSGPCLWPDGTVVEFTAPVTTGDQFGPNDLVESNGEDPAESTTAPDAEPAQSGQEPSANGPAPQVRRLIRSS